MSGSGEVVAAGAVMGSELDEQWDQFTASWKLRRSQFPISSPPMCLELLRGSGPLKHETAHCNAVQGFRDVAALSCTLAAVR
jgi:hypothetical protein